MEGAVRAVTRESLPALPYAVEEIYGIRNSGKYGRLKQTYNEMYRIYNWESLRFDIKPEIVITEDSNSGYQFFEDVCKKNKLNCLSSEGKSNIFRDVEQYKQESVLVIADGAAFGPEMEKMMKLMQVNKNLTLYLPESFEWLILQTDMVMDRDINEIMDAPWDFIESTEYMSWERFFTYLLVQKTEGTYWKYSKRALNSVYLQDNHEKKILGVMEKIDFTWKS